MFPQVKIKYIDTTVTEIERKLEKHLDIYLFTIYKMEWIDRKIIKINMK